MTIAIYAANLNQPADVDVDSAGNIYVAETGAGQISKIATNGAKTTIASGQNPASVTADSNGNIFSVYSNSTTLFKNNQAFATSPLINQPTGVATDAAGNIYVSCAGQGTVVKISAS